MKLPGWSSLLFCLVALVAVRAAEPPVLPASPALLPDNIVYCRLASFQPASSWPELAGRFDKWIAQGAPGVILDVRSNSTPDDFDGAARLAGLFLPPGTPLFNVRVSGQQHSYASVGPESPGTPVAVLPATVPMIVLIDDRTTGAAEAFAAAFRNHGALLMGQSVPVQSASPAEPGGAAHPALHELAEEIVLPDGTSLAAHPVVPDVGIVVDDKKEQAALALIGQEHIADVIEENAERHRLSEAALVRGEDPEITLSVVPGAVRGSPTLPLSTAQDAILVDALASLKAIRLSQGTPAPTPGRPNAPDSPGTVR
jgi:C-terminal processing protease CtpA/Prc